MLDEISTWKRPDNLPIPTVYRKYQGILEMPDGIKPKFIIQDVTDKYLEDVISILSERLCREGSMFGTLNILDDPTSLKEMQDLWRKLAKQNASLVALVDDGSPRPRVAGANLTYVCRIQDKFSPDDFKGTAMKAIARDAMVYAFNYINIFQRYGIKEYLSSKGLIVDPKYRGQGLGVELLRARIDLGKAIGVKINVNLFTTIQGQKSAKKAGMDVMAELPYEMFKNEDGTEVYPNIHPKTFKIMAMRLE